jgi:arylsulfatase A-like enzyme
MPSSNHSAITRRGFTATLGAGTLIRAAEQSRPNVLWITCEDIGPHLHACGDNYSVTPNLDALAARGQIYMNAWSNAPVCAPARTTIITGMYPPSTGAEHMRSMTSLPAGMKMYPQFLREAGYYCTNNSKEDYNLEKPGQVWDESSNKGHWRNRGKGRPFFAIFNLGQTHEGQIRRRPHTLVHDPAKVRVPAYHPDTPEVRHDWAQYYDNITTMDAHAGRILDDLRKDGLADDTIVFFYGDHGSGMPRSKRFPFNSGLNVCIVVSVPEKWRHLAPSGYKIGSKSDRLVGFIDLAPTMLSLAGIKAATYHQGQAFMGKYEQPERPYNYGFRGRMDERYDMMRTVRDKRYVYIRNYMPHKIYGQHVSYMFETPTTQVWKKLYDEGKLKPPKTYFWETKPAEELYDLQNDRDEVNNLAKSPQHQETLKRLRKAQQDLALKIRDVGFLSEDDIHRRSKGSTPYELGHDPKRFPFERIMDTAELASSLKPGVTDELVKRFEETDSAVRYWAAMGILMRGAAGVREAKAPLQKALKDSSPSVRVAAAEALGRYGDNQDVSAALETLRELAPPDKNGAYISMMALNALDAMGSKARPALDTIKTMPTVDPQAPARARSYVARLVKDLPSSLER